jgi:predicted AAA+ superfamily ATPase
MINRLLKTRIEHALNRKKIVVVIGARQVGKTTLLLNGIIPPSSKSLFLNCDNADTVIDLQGKSSTQLKSMFDGYDYVLIDEAQRVRDIGLTLKMIGDLNLSTKFLVTGSSSLELANKINEPATGRILEYDLYPFSLPELANSTSNRDEKRMLTTRMVYGSYPEVINNPSDAQETLMSLSNNYLYRDLLSFGSVQKPDELMKLVRALALQIGSEVSYNELAGLVGLDKESIERYINLLEKCFVVRRLTSFSRNLRNEIKKSKKIYFCDNGIRNAVLSNFAPLELRPGDEIGHLFENLMVIERIKRNEYCGSYAQQYFWRTNTKEIDFVEEKDGKLHCYEFKWNLKKKEKTPSLFLSTYPGSSFEVINPDNFMDFLDYTAE